MNRDDILNLIKSLSRSQGFYGRMLESLNTLKIEEPDIYEKLLSDWEAQNFKDDLDFILFIEA